MHAPVGQGDVRTDKVKFDGLGYDYFYGSGEIADAFGDAIDNAATSSQAKRVADVTE